MAPDCDFDHRDLRDRTVGLEKDLEAIQRILEAVTVVLRENLVTISGHDKASQDLRMFLMDIAKDLQARVTRLEESSRGWAEVQAMSNANAATLEQALVILSRVEEEMMRFYGLDESGRPNPLALQIAEAIALVRELNDRDPKTGDPLKGPDLWWKRTARVVNTAIAVGIVALAWKILGPYISAALARH